MLELLGEIGVYNFAIDDIHTRKDPITLDSKKDWYTVLSGDKRKKVMIVSAIIKKPDILILDKIFNDLDLESREKAQYMLKKHLPDTVILSADHNAQYSNDNEFYNLELHFSNQSASLQELTESPYSPDLHNEDQL